MDKLIAAIIKNIYVVQDGNAYSNLINELSSLESCKIVSFVNAHAINLCYKNIEFAKVLSASDYLLRDGIGMKLMYKFCSMESGINMNGTDFIPYFLDQNIGKNLAIFGTAEPYLGQAIEKLRSDGHKIISSCSGFEDLEIYMELAKRNKPDIILLAMGMPKQEQLASFLKGQLDFPCVIINGGAVVDFIGGKVVRAPLWLQNLGLEWLYRLLQEPSRLFRRYVIGNFDFLLRLPKLKQYINA